MEQIVSVLPDKAFHYREVLAISFMAALVRHHVHQVDFILIFQFFFLTFLCVLGQVTLNSTWCRCHLKSIFMNLAQVKDLPRLVQIAQQYMTWSVKMGTI